MCNFRQKVQRNDNEQTQKYPNDATHLLVIIVGILVLVEDRQAELDEFVDAAREDGGLAEVEARGEEGGLEQEPHEVLHGGVVRVLGELVLKNGRSQRSVNGGE